MPGVGLHEGQTVMGVGALTVSNLGVVGVMVANTAVTAPIIQYFVSH